MLLGVALLAWALLGAEVNGDRDLADLHAKALPQNIAEQRIDLARPNTNLLAAAVFHETNGRRRAAGLAALEFNANAARAAQLQSSIMAERGSLSHENPERPKLRTLTDRVKAVGLKPRFAAENVATAFGLQYRSGSSFYRRTENGRTILSTTQTDPRFLRTPTPHLPTTSSTAG